jgi:hypothetical protein
MVSSLLAAAAEAEAAVLEAVEAEVLEEQPASERTPAAAMTLMREIKVLRFIGDDPFCSKTNLGKAGEGSPFGRAGA